MAAFIPAILGGIGAAAGIFGQKPQKQATEQTTNQSQQSNASTSGSSQPLYDDQQLAIRNQIFQTLLSRLNQDPSLSGYTSTGLQNINRAGDLRRQALENVLAQRGLSSSPTAARAIANTESNRISDAVNFQNQIPLLADSLNRQRVGDLSSFFTSLPVGQQTQGQSNQSSSGTAHTVGNGALSGGSPIAGGLLGAGSILAGLYGQGAFSRKPPNYSSGVNPNYNGEFGG